MKFFSKKYESLALDTFVIYAKDTDAKIIGGVCGYMVANEFGSWAAVDYAWVDENRRLRGLGSELFGRVEALAREKNCRSIQLFTWAYQAVGFYKKLGFECVGVIPEWIENYDAVFFRKRL